MLVFLIGYMGSGKSSIGRQAARKAGLPFIDMDTVIEERSGMSVSEFFRDRGESAFRSMEREILGEIISGTDAVVATGGGVPCFSDNMEVMNAAGGTVYLKMSPRKLASRLEHGKYKRPLIKDKSAEELEGFIAGNLEQREPHYSKAKMVIACDDMGDDRIADHIAMYIENYK